jgi:hypothetical protein
MRQMHDLRLKSAAVVIGGALALASALAGCEEEKGPAEKLGEKLDDSVEQAGDKLEEAADKIEARTD